ncbi:MAG: aminopeptidase [Aquificaceae bacterium]|nr:aminopeptidase [Aquificaceae bacterium]MDW8032743.1 aminopeptidase [Aquificaceae bacterium]MDW8294126.1 aminopeptidase [Aquificaceae bacterium]
MYEEHIYKLYRVNMNLREGERLLLLSDGEKEYLLELMEEFLAVAQGFIREVKWLLYPSLGSHGKEPPEEAWRLAFGDRAVQKLKDMGLLERVIHKEDYSEGEVLQILKEEGEGVPHVVVAFSYYSTTHTFFRKALTEGFGCRYASMPLFEPEMFLGPMDVDWNYVASLSTDVADMLSEAQWAHVRAEGTELEFSLEGRSGVADTGLLHQRGQYGNLPAGEAFIAPLETSAFGKLTLTYGPNRKLSRPLTLKFRKGAVEEMEGFEPYRQYLEEVFKKHEGARTIAEFGVGTNPKARRPDNVLEAEKILGTVHIAIGDNHSFGGINKVPFHTDYVVFEPQVTIGGKGWQKRLLEKGRLRT